MPAAVLRPSFVLAAALAAIALAPAAALEIGVNLHTGGTTAGAREQIATLMRVRQLRSARVDLLHGRDNSDLREQVARIREAGGTVQASLQTSHQWDHGCRGDLPQVESEAHAQALQEVRRFADVILDYELLNETQLRPEIRAEVPWNSAGHRLEPYEGKRCIATLAAALRGMSRAVGDVRSETGRPLRVILGVVGRDFGFLRFMERAGVRFDVVGFHVYPAHTDPSLLDDAWYGAGGPLRQLAQFGRPIHVNEFNCGEINAPTYENEPGRPTTEACLRSLARHLKALLRVSVDRLESVHLYELLDDPSKPPPENRFGLMHSPDRPKVHLALVTAVAGGSLTSEERSALLQRRLVTVAEIERFRAMRTGSRPAPR